MKNHFILIVIVCVVMLRTQICATEEYQEDRSKVTTSPVNNIILKFLKHHKINSELAKRNRRIPVTIKRLSCQSDGTKINGVCMKSYNLHEGLKNKVLLQDKEDCLPNEKRINGICRKSLKYYRNLGDNTNRSPSVKSRCLFCDNGVRLKCDIGFEWNHLKRVCEKKKNVVDIDCEDEFEWDFKLEDCVRKEKSDSRIEIKDDGPVVFRD